MKGGLIISKYECLKCKCKINLDWIRQVRNFGYFYETGIKKKKREKQSWEGKYIDSIHTCIEMSIETRVVKNAAQAGFIIELGFFWVI